MFTLDLIASLGGLAIPPLFDFLKKKFVPAANDTPERTMGTLATTNPEALEGYVKGVAEHLKAKVKFFQRDVTGSPSQWVIDLRAAIRPLAVIISFALLALGGFTGFALEVGTRLFCETTISSWMGSRLVRK